MSVSTAAPCFFSTGPPLPPQGRRGLLLSEMPGHTPQTACWLLALGLEGPYALDRRLALWEDSDEGRNGRHVVGATGTARRSDEAPLCRGRLFARHTHLCLSQG